jgi:hypothetical protein
VQTVYESPFFQLRFDERRSVAWLVRTAQSSKDQGIVEREIRGLTDFLAGERISKMCLIVDVRAAIGRNDEAFESTILPRFLAISDRFPRVGMLVATPVGKMQLMRLARERGISNDVFVDEAAARAFAGLGPSDG